VVIDIEETIVVPINDYRALLACRSVIKAILPICKKTYDDCDSCEDAVDFINTCTDPEVQALVASIGNKLRVPQGPPPDDLVIAVDFDGTLCTHAFPEIGEPDLELIEKLKLLQASGCVRLLLWTCRSGTYLDEAVAWCEQHGLRFDAINKNKFGKHGFFGDPKAVADIYLDDRAMTPEQFMNQEFSAEKT